MKNSDFNTDRNDEIGEELCDDSILQIIGAVNDINEVDLPIGFHDEVMRAIRIDASFKEESKGKKGVLKYKAKIFKTKYIYIAATAACLFLALLFIYPLVGMKTAKQFNGAEAAPAAPPAPAASAPMAAAVATEAEMPMLYSNVASEGFSYGGEVQEASDVMREEEQMAAAPDGEIDMDTGAGMEPASESMRKNESESSQTVQKIIKTAYYDIDVTDFDKTIAEIQRIADTSGGYVESYSSSIYSTYAYPSAEGGRRDLKNGYLCLRIPQNSYSSAKIKLEDLGKITSTSESIDNITSQYIDASARLEVKKTEEQRLLELFGKADKIDDLISLESRLSYVRSDIEAMTAQLQNWDRSVSFSTINISVNEVVDYSQLQSLDPTLSEKITEGFHRSAANFIYNVERLIVTTAENSIAIVIFLIVVLIVLSAMNILVRKRRKKDEKI